jgi:excisionase family DNA binding protein
MVTARVVAEQLGVSPATILRWTRQGDLPAIRLPSGALRYDSDTLAAWLKARATPGRGDAVPPAADPDAALAHSPLRSVVPPVVEDKRS